MKKLLLIIPVLLIAGIFSYACQESVSDLNSALSKPPLRHTWILQHLRVDLIQPGLPLKS